MKIGSRIRLARVMRGLTQKQLGAAVGVSAPAVTQWENDETLPNFERLEGIESALNLKKGALMSGDDKAFVDEETDDIESIPTNVRYAPEIPPPPDPSTMPLDVPILAAGEPRGDGSFFLDAADVVKLVRRPPGIIGNKHVFGFYAPDDSMVPMFHAGDLVFADRKRAPSAGRAAVIEFSSPSGSESKRVILAVLIRRTSAEVVYRRLTETEEAPPTAVPADEVSGFYRVLSLQELMGV